MEGLVLWKHLALPNARVWLVCTASPRTGKLTPVVLPCNQVEQEEYVELPEQEEALINVFTTPGGADRYKASLAEDSSQNFVVKRISFEEFLKLMKGVSEAYQTVRNHAVRFDLYDVKPDGHPLCREILFSRWIPKH